MFPPGNTSTDLVTFTVLANGTDIRPDYRVIRIEVNREVNRIPSAILIIEDGDAAGADFRASSSETFIPGVEIEIKAGYHSTEQTIYKGVIVKHGIRFTGFGGSHLRLECRDKAYKMTLGRNNRVFTDTKDSDAMGTIFSAHGLTGQAEDTVVTKDKILQQNASDWDFINLRAEACNKMVFVDDGAIEVKSASFTGTPVADLAFGSGIVEVETEMDARTQYGALTAQTWDSSTQEPLETDAADPGFSQPGNLTANDLASAAGLGEFVYRHPGQVNQEEIQSMADSMLARSRLARCQGRVTSAGNPVIKPGVLVNLGGLGDRFNGTAYVTGVRHEIIGGDFLTHARFGMDPEPYSHRYAQDIQAPMAGGLVPAVYGLQFGVVTDLEDPLGIGRIKVRLPVLHGDQDGCWMRLATLDAGDQRGSIFKPEVDDEVVVGFVDNDPGHPIALGMLHSSALAPPVSANNDNHLKGFVTREGMKIWFDDEKKIIEISTPGGYLASLDEDQKTITLQDANGNKLIMNDQGISIESCQDLVLKATGDIKAEGLNIELKSQVQFKAEGAAGSEISSSAMTTVKGSVVQIN
jgi:Rhs element Vgr protein